MRKFITKLTVAALTLVLAGGLVFGFILPQLYLPVLPFVLLFFYLATVAVHAWQVKLAKNNMAKFTRSNMLITFLKLVVYSVFAVAYIAVDRENALVFVICLMMIYLVFTALEVVESMKISKGQF